jgi:hypothetical protein
VGAFLLIRQFSADARAAELLPKNRGTVASNSVSVHYEGTAPFAGALASDIEKAGYDVALDDELQERRGATGGQIIETDITVSGHPAVWGPLVLAVRKFRKHFPRAKIRIEDVDESRFDADGNEISD